MGNEEEVASAEGLGVFGLSDSWWSPKMKCFGSFPNESWRSCESFQYLACLLRSKGAQIFFDSFSVNEVVFGVLVNESFACFFDLSFSCKVNESSSLLLSLAVGDSPSASQMLAD